VLPFIRALRATRLFRREGSFQAVILEERVEAAQKSYVADAEEEVRLMSHMANDLLAFARAGMRTAEIRLVSVPLLPLVRQICAREAGSCKIKIEIAENLAALAHPELLSRAIANVLRNAARYAGDGVLSVAARPQHDKIRLSIADQGPGVPPETLARLFDPFYRLEPDRARATGGSGLGPAIVKTCVEACQGTVAAHNLHPSGLEISIVLQAASN
jgi:two-component system sensor histidine kinase CpxA